jgi:hypothetical protein
MYVTCINSDCGSDNIKYLIPPDSDEIFCAVCGEHFSLSKVEFQIKEDAISDEALEEVEWPGKLEHGKLYDCMVDFKGEIEKESIIPLAKDPNSFKRLVMMDARRLFTKNPNFIEEIAEMTFDEIMNEGISSKYPFDYEISTIILRPLTDGTLVDFKGLTKFFDFIDSHLR